MSLVVLLLGLVGIPAALAFVVPRPWLPAYTLGMAYFGGIVWVDSSRVHADFVDALGMAMFSLLALGAAGGLVARWSLVASRPARTSEPSRTGLPAAAGWGLLALAPAAAITAMAVSMARAWGASALALHAGVLVVAAAWWLALSQFVPRGLSGSAHWLHPAQVMRASGALAMVLAVAWSLGVAAEVTEAAESAAEGAPYCIEVPGPDGLRPARSRFDLSGFQLQAGKSSIRHAVLAVGSPRSPRWFYWSYRKEAFFPEFLGGVLRCEPVVAHARTLAWLSSAPADPVDAFWLAGGRWRIPAEWHPAMGDAPPRILVRLQGRRFEPLTDTRIDPRSWDFIRQTVTVTLCTPERLHSWHVPHEDVNYRLRTVGLEHRLVQQEVLSRGGPPRIQQLHPDAAAATTWIQCDGDWCRHAFQREGRVVDFMHPASDLPIWEDLESALWQRVKGLALEWPTAPARFCDAR